jgi:hypothetical protein
MFISDLDLDFYPSRIQGSKKHRISDPGSGSATLEKRKLVLIIKNLLQNLYVISLDVGKESLRLNLFNKSSSRIENAEDILVSP